MNLAIPFQSGPHETAAIRLESIRPCLEGIIPIGIATLAPDGTPNVTYISQAHYMDCEHVALTYQFFNKTRANLLNNPQALLQLVDPVSARTYRMTISYVRTETSGPLFESMRAKLAGIASHTGMADVFKLAGADVCRVLAIEAVPGECLPQSNEAPELLSALRRVSTALVRQTDLSAALDTLTDGLTADFAIAHAAVLLAAADGKTLYTVASRGYEASGVGAEIKIGSGVIGMAAQERIPIRINHMTTDVTYARGVGTRMGADFGELAIPFPGLEQPGSQLAVPIEDGQKLIGVLFVESEADLSFSYDHEDALVVLATQLATVIRSNAVDSQLESRTPTAAAMKTEDNCPPLRIRYYAANNSVFVDDDYLIKGVAGSIFWILLKAYDTEGRCEFTNRELKLNPELRLPVYSENLEARLILLERRLAEKPCGVAIEKTGRGRFRLRIDRPIQRVDMQAECPEL